MSLCMRSAVHIQLTYYTKNYLKTHQRASLLLCCSSLWTNHCCLSVVKPNYTDQMCINPQHVLVFPVWVLFDKSCSAQELFIFSSEPFCKSESKFEWPVILRLCRQWDLAGLGLMERHGYIHFVYNKKSAAWHLADPLRTLW